MDVFTIDCAIFKGNFMRLNLFILLLCTPLTYNITMDGTKTQPTHPKCMCGHMRAKYNMECALCPISPTNLG